VHRVRRITLHDTRRTCGSLLRVTTMGFGQAGRLGGAGAGSAQPGPGFGRDGAGDGAGDDPGGQGLGPRSVMVGGQKIQAGLAHARKTVQVAERVLGGVQDRRRSRHPEALSGTTCPRMTSV
jgi:hypothetical protein